jgi:RNA polymerase sigma-70 factor, ECF subfamily
MRRNPASVDDSVLENVADPRQDFELDFLKRKYGAEFEASLREAFESLEASERNLLRHYYGRRLSIDTLGAMYHVHRATMARRVHRTTEALVVVTRERLAARLGIASGDVSSILRLVHSQLELTLVGILAPT